MRQAAPPVPLTIPDTVRPGEGPMDRADLQAVLTHYITQAKDYLDSEVAPARAHLTELYEAESLGNEVEGRSKVVVSSVRDVVRGAKPSIVRAVFGAEWPAVVEPWVPGSEAKAERATEFLRHTITLHNEGERVLGDVIDDGLIRRMGVVKWWWEDTPEVETVELADDEAVSAYVLEHPQAQLASVEGTSYTFTTPRGVARFAAVPGDEFLFDPEARSIEDATFVAHITNRTRGELIAMGIDATFLDEHGGLHQRYEGNEETEARESLYASDAPSTTDASTGEIQYVEAYPYVDEDGDGVAELRRVICLGPAYTVWKSFPADERPFAVWSPISEAHRLQGKGYADLAKDMQFVESGLTRASLDSLAASIFPRTVYKDGDANLQDLKNTAIGAPIRTRSGPGAVQSLTHSFVGKESLPFLALFREQLERRTGLSNGAAGLDADALQSSTAGAVNAAVQGSREQLEMTTRAFVAGVLRPLVRALYRLYCEHRPAPTEMMLQSGWQTVDPASWDPEAQVRIVAPLGAGLVEQRIETLMLVKGTQEGLMEKLGPVNPLVKASQYFYTLSQLLKLRGFMNPTLFFTPPDDAQIEEAARAAAQQPPSDPVAAALEKELQLEAAKAQHEAKLKEAEFQRELQKVAMENAMRERELVMKEQAMLLENDRLRDQQAAELVLKTKELELKYQMQIEQAALDAQIERERMTTQAETQRVVAREKQVTVRKKDDGSYEGSVK